MMVLDTVTGKTLTAQNDVVIGIWHSMPERYRPMDEVPSERGQPIEKMTVPALRALAAERGIDVSGFSAKPDIIAALAAHGV